MQVPAKGFTHGGKFHADDVFSTALLQIVRPDFTVQRGFTVPDDFDGIVYDVGLGLFDHHQEPRETRPNGVPYAAFGLLWLGTHFMYRWVGQSASGWLQLAYQSLIPFASIAPQMLLGFVVAGVLFGVVGSFIFVGKYLRV